MLGTSKRNDLNILFVSDQYSKVMVYRLLYYRLEL